MFKPARWRSDKNKFKAVFKLQFHATQVTLQEGDSLMISVIPADVGKPTAKLEKSRVDNGGCYWEKSIYETVKFTHDAKTGKINERVYHFIIATGSTKFGILGEVSFDFACYAGAKSLSSLSLPLKTAKFEAVLHVSIERIQDAVDQREVEGGENFKHGFQTRTLKPQSSTSERDDNTKTNLAQDGSSDNVITHVAELKKGNNRASIASDVMISSSDSMSGLDTFQESGMNNNSIHDDHNNFLSSQSDVSIHQKATPNASTVLYGENQRLQSEWSGGSAPDASTDDSSNSPHETLLREESRDTNDILTDKLKTEVAVLARQSEVSEVELQTLRKNIVKESKRGQDLARELKSVKQERDAFKEECERLKDLQKRAEADRVRNKLQVDGGDPQALLEELRQELNHQKESNANLRLQLRKTQESNSELILAVRELDVMLEAKNSEIINLSNKSMKSEDANSSDVTNSKCDANIDEDQIALEELVKDHSSVKDAYQLEEKIMDLYGELDICKRERDDIEMQMEQLSLDYEILKQENHDISYKLEQSQLQEELKMQYECSTSYATLNDLNAQIESLDKELKKQSKEFSGSLVTISELEKHVESLEEVLEKQAQSFEAELEVLIRAKVEQEKRAIRAEEALRKAQRRNVNTAERLQKEFKSLYMQMSSTFDANDKLNTKLMTEANELRLEKNCREEMLYQANKELQSVKDTCEEKLLELSSQIHFKKNQLEQMQSESEKKSEEIETQRKHAEETHRLLSDEILMLQSEIERLAKVNSLVSEQEKQNETLRTELKHMKASTNNLSQEIILLQSQIRRLTQENNIFSEQVEQIETLSARLEQMKESIEEIEIQVLRGITEGDEIEITRALLKMEVEKLKNEFNTMRCVKFETESIAKNLHSEVETLKTRYDELKQSLLADELEKQILRKQAIQLTEAVKTKEDMLSVVEKKMKDKFSQAPVINVHDATSIGKSISACGSTEDVDLIKNKRFSEGQLKLREVSLETSSTEFLVKEKDLSIGIEEFENDGCPTTLEERNSDILSEDGLEDSATYSRNEANLGELSHDMTSSKGKNQSMEGELKDMKNRYSALSLKFAEGEGERQKLVMKLRSIKNAKKSLT